MCACGVSAQLRVSGEVRVSLLSVVVVKLRQWLACTSGSHNKAAHANAQTHNTHKQHTQHTQPITMRMTGCPNGCARPYMAELGWVGDGPNPYQVSFHPALHPVPCTLHSARCTLHASGCLPSCVEHCSVMPRQLD